jgi:hypothetical protein
MPENVLEIGALLLSALGAIAAWYFNERSKRAWEEYTRKENNYKQLLFALKGFFVATQSKELRDEFLQQVNLCWLYCPDEVIQKAYTFMDSVHTESTSGTEVSEKAMGDFVAAVRADMLTRKIVQRTSLKGEDFRRFASR